MPVPTCTVDVADTSKPDGSSYAYCLAAEIRALKAALAASNNRNFLINGSMEVAQRPSVSLTGSYQYGQVDRWMGALGGSGLGGVLLQATGQSGFGIRSGYGCSINNATFTSGNPIWQYRMEARDSVKLTSKTVTLQFKIYQNTGANYSISYKLMRPTTTVDDFSAQTTLVNPTVVEANCANATYTTCTVTVDLASFDLTKGLAIYIFGTDLTTVVNKSFNLADVQLVIGTSAPEFQSRLYADERRLCNRYFRYVRDVVGVAIAANTLSCLAQLQGMRKIPILTASGTLSFVNGITGIVTQSSANVSAVDSFSSGDAIYFTAANFSGLSADRVFFMHSSAQVIYADAEL